VEEKIEIKQNKNSDTSLSNEKENKETLNKVSNEKVVEEENVKKEEIVENIPKEEPTNPNLEKEIQTKKLVSLISKRYT